jgi:uncharacterized protein YbjT (DUF2867 family)
MFPHLTRMQLVAADDVGAFAAAAFVDPQRFNGRDLPLATDELTMGEIADRLSRVLGKHIVARSLSPQEAIESGLYPVGCAPGNGPTR